MRYMLLICNDVPRHRADHGQAPGPGQGEGPRRRHPLPGAARPRPPRPDHLGARRAVPAVQRGLPRVGRRRPGAGGAVRRGHPPRPAARRADARRARGGGTAGAHAAAPRPAGGPGRRGRHAGTAGGAGPGPVGQRRHRRGHHPARRRAAPGPGGALPAAGRHRRLPRHRPDARSTDWPQIAQLYGQLSRVLPTPIVALNRAVAVAMADGPAAGLALVDRLEASGDLAGYPLLPATRADLLRRLGRLPEAAGAYRAAIDLAPTDAERDYLRRRLAETSAPPAPPSPPG